MNDLEILILPLPIPQFEADIWQCVLEKPRPWTDTEREYLRRNPGFAESLADWFRQTDSYPSNAKNLEYLKSLFDV